MSYGYRRVQPNHKTTIPRECLAIAAESETDERGTQRLRVASASKWVTNGSKRGFCSEYTTGDCFSFWDWIGARLSKRCHTRIWAYGMARVLQLTRFFELWERGDWIPEYHCLRDPPIIVKGKLWGRTVTLLDLGNWIEKPIDEVMSMMHMEEYISKYMPSDAKWLSKVADVQTHVVGVAVQSILDMIVDCDMGNFQPTATGQAMSLYRHRFMRHRIDICQSEGQYRLEQAAFVGGQILCPGGGHAYEMVVSMDVNGLYPSVMSYYPMPHKRIDHTTVMSVDRLKRLCSERTCVARVAIDSLFEPYPGRVNSQGVWRTGRFSTVLCGPELYRALRCGHVREVHECVAYESAILFDEVQSYLYDLRNTFKCQGELLKASVVKWIANGLYGKWGQENHRYVRSPDHDVKGRWGNSMLYDGEHDTIKMMRYIAGQAEVLTAKERATNSFPAIAAAICSFARERMRTYREIAGLGNVYYQYVDTLHVSLDGLDNLSRAGAVQENKLGMLRHVGQYMHAAYHGPQLWEADGTVYAGCLVEGAERIGNATWRLRRPETMRSMIQREPDGLVRSNEQEYRLSVGTDVRIGNKGIANRE